MREVARDGADVLAQFLCVLDEIAIPYQRHRVPVASPLFVATVTGEVSEDGGKGGEFYRRILAVTFPVRVVDVSISFVSVVLQFLYAGYDVAYVNDIGGEVKFMAHGSYLLVKG